MKKPERQGLPLVQGKYWEEKACNKGHNNNNIMGIIIYCNNNFNGKY
jgi:hypothetical protein